jgi:rSAM/selenodomain-associated transferase 1
MQRSLPVKMQAVNSRTKLVVFLKAPRAGTVKTRLAASIGKEAALAAYKRMAEHLLENLNGLSDVQIRYSPDDAEAETRQWLGNHFEFHPQGSGDLGERLQRAFQENASRGIARAVVIGSDCPYVARSDIESAWASLASHDVVIGPAADGGYWLIGLRSSQPTLFEKIPWSTDRVLEATLNRMCAAKLSHELLRQLSDIDTETEWQRYSAGLLPACITIEQHGSANGL